MRNILFICLTLIAGLTLPAAADQIIHLKLDGEMKQGSLIRGETIPGAKAMLDDLTLPVSEDGRFVFGFDRDHEGEAKLTIILPEGQEIITLRPEKRDYVIQRIDGLPQKYVTPMEPETLERIKREAKLKAGARPKNTPATWFAEKFIWPARGRISGVFGSQRILNGEPKRPHYGVDVAAPTGTPVISPAGGVVTLAEKDMYFEGGLIFIDHGHGVVSALMHLSDVFVKAGDEVKQGQKIAAIGATGRATGPHLHWHIYWRSAMVDPQMLVGPMQKEEAKETPKKAEAAE
jgi:murein DD-endopeptidase MepM/ murein hydrolase activator NlpD